MSNLTSSHFKFKNKLLKNQEYSSIVYCKRIKILLSSLQWHGMFQPLLELNQSQVNVFSMHFFIDFDYEIESCKPNICEQVNGME